LLYKNTSFLVQSASITPKAYENKVPIKETQFPIEI